MAQPIWITPAGSLGIIPESEFFQQNLQAYDPDATPVFFRLIAGTLPDGIQLAANGAMTGVPLAVASLQGVPVPVNRDVTSKFAVRAYTTKVVNNVTVIDRIADRTFTLTISGNDIPQFVTPAGSLGTFYDSTEISIQVEFTHDDPGETAVVRLVAGELPGGISVSAAGLISGYIAPTPNVDEPPGYDLTPIYVEPYDFVVSAINKNFEFTLEVTDGKSSDLRTFSIFVYDRASLTADNTDITADNTFVTADVSTTRAPFLLNPQPSELGIIRSDNNFAYQFRGFDYDKNTLKYAISVNQGSGLPPGLGLDPNSGWYYGFIPDQGTTEVTYSFNITVYESGSINNTVTVISTTAGTNRLTCASTANLAVGMPLVFDTTVFGGILANTVYYISSIPTLSTFTVSVLPAGAAVNLLTESGTMIGTQVVASAPYPFTLTVTGNIDAEVTWLTPEDLGTVVNGQTSLLKVEAVNLGGRELKYRLKSGAFNELPQGLQLLPTGEIAGRISFNNFAIDLGATTFDRSQSTPTRITETTFDSSFRFTVNAYAEDTEQLLYKVRAIEVIDGGIGYSAVTTPVIVINSPVGASASPALVGNVTVSAGAITSVSLSDQGSGYTSTATVTITQGFGGSGANLQPVMSVTGTRDVVSVFKEFRLRLIREYNAPYQNLLVQAMPPPNDRALLTEILDNEEVFVPDYIFRPTDPNFGKATKVIYQHAFGLAPDRLETYVESLYLNHYWKNLVLGSVETAQARDPITGEVIYEVVYARVIDDLVNAQGESVAKIQPLPYPIIDPNDGSTELRVVYPNSLVNMRDQVIDVVGQISTVLPLWMTSKQEDGRVLGFTPAWVMCYTKPGRSNQIAYYLQQEFGTQLNNVDFKVDRYILDRLLSRNWDTTTQDWTPQPSLTTFDRFASPDQVFIGFVDIATTLAFADVNFRTTSYINDLGGLDGIIQQINGKTLIFAQQEDYQGPPGSNYATTDDAWQDYTVSFDSAGFSPETPGQGFDASTTVPGGYTEDCTATTAGTNRITCGSTALMNEGDAVWFTGSVFGGIQSISPGGITKVYYILDIVNSTQFTVTETLNGTSAVTLSTATGVMTMNYGNQRMGIWLISVDPVTTQVTLTLQQSTAESQYVQIRQGRNFGGDQLYYPTVAPPGQTRVVWLLLPESSSTETTFDQGSMAFEEPLDMYDPTDAFDKYLVFPRTNILV